jgi:hypothetical protein
MVNPVASSLIWMGALTGTLMFLNVWLVIWPNQKVVIGIKEGDAAAAAAKAGLASRTNTLFSGPMLLGMLGSKHLYVSDASGTGLGAACVLILHWSQRAVRSHGPDGQHDRRRAPEHRPGGRDLGAARAPVRRCPERLMSRRCRRYRPDREGSQTPPRRTT